MSSKVGECIFPPFSSEVLSDSWKNIIGKSGRGTVTKVSSKSFSFVSFPPPINIAISRFPIPLVIAKCSRERYRFRFAYKVGIFVCKDVATALQLSDQDGDCHEILDH